MISRRPRRSAPPGSAPRITEQRYRSLFQSMPDGCAHCRMLYEDGRPHDFEYLEVNPAFEAITRLKGVVGRRVSEVIPGIRTTNPELFETYGRVAASGRPERFETFVAAIDVWFDVSVFSPARGEFVAVFADVTKARRADLALRESEDAFRSFFEHAPIGKVMTAPDGSLLRVNRAFCAMLGRSAEELEACGFADVTHPDDLPASREVVRALLAGETDGCQVEKRYLHKDGRAVWAHVVTRLHRDSQGRPRFFLTHVQDIDRRKRSEEAERRLRKLLAETEAVARVGGWEYDVATGRIVWTDEVYRMHGVDPASHDPNELANEAAFYAPDDQARLDEAFRRAVEAGEPYDLELRLRPVGAAEIRVRTIGRAETKDGRVVRVFGHMQDVSELRRAADALVESKRRFWRLLENAPDAIYRIRLAPDQAVEYVSPAVTRMTGYTPAEYQADPQLVKSVTHPEDRGLLESALRGELPPSAPHVVRWLHKDGSVLWTEHRTLTIRDEAGRPVAVEGIARDVTRRLRAEEEIHIRTRALEAAANAVVITDTTGLIQWVNPAFTTLTGYSPAEVIGQNPRVLKSGSHDGNLYQQLWRTIRGGEVWSGELVNRRKDGTLYTEQMTITPVRSESGAVTHFVAIKLDVTERRQAEAARLESEERLREVAENIGEVFWINSPDLGRTLYVSPAYEAVYGRSCQSLYEDPRSFLDAVHPDDRARVAQTLGDYARGLLDLSFRVVRPDGSQRWVEARAVPIRDAQGAVVRIVGSARDVTELRKAEEQLRLQKETLQTVVDNIPVAVNFFDASGRLLFVNREWQRLLGWTAAEARAADVLEACYPDPAERQAAHGFMLEAAGAWGDFRPRTRAGRALDTSWAYVRLSDGTILGVGQDMTERRMLEAEIRQAQKMEAIGRLAGGVAHDFNNLLGVITGYGEFLQGRIADDPQLARYADQLLKAAGRAAGLTRQLLAFSRRQVLQPRILDLNAVVAETDKMLRRLIGEDVQLVTALDARLGSVLADPGQIEQVLMNLAVNARDAMAHGGRLTIETHDVALDAGLARQRPGVPPGSYAMLAVRDTGAGMTPEVKARIFEPFFTTKEVGRGTGLGLATVHGIVSQSGGHVWVESEPGRGSTFEIYFPRADGPRAERDAEPPAAASPPRGSGTVLVVEDEDSLREIVRERLESAGYTVLEARDGRQAIELCGGRDQPVDLLLTDVVMPQIGGRELAQRLQQRWPGLRVLYMSGYTDDSVVLHGVATEGLDLLQKPFSGAVLAHRIRELLDRPS